MRRGLLLPAGVLLALAFSLAPLLWMLATSLKSPAAFAARPPRLLPDGDLSAYRAVLAQHDLGRFAANSLVVAGATTILAIALAAPAAYAIARLRPRWGNLALMAALAGGMFPQVALVGGIYRILSAAGLLNTHAGLVLPYTGLTLPLALWLLTTFFREVPRDLEEAARVDGAGIRDVLLRVFLPVAAPAVATTAILVFLFAWNEFFFALLVMTDPAKQTLPVGIAKFQGPYEIPWRELSAAGVLACLPTAWLVFLFQRRIVSGLTAGAVKG